MASVNKVIIVGNLGNDPEVRQFQNGGKVATINVATSERWTDKTTGEQKEQTEWHRISLFNRLAEIAEQYLRKGSSVYIEGSLQTRKWTDAQGVERYTTEIKASSMQMLGSAPSRQNKPFDQFSAPQSYPQAAPSDSTNTGYPNTNYPNNNYPANSSYPNNNYPNNPQPAQRNDLGNNQFAPNQTLANNAGDDDIPF